MRSLPRWFALFSAMLVALGLPLVAAAAPIAQPARHPLGNFTVNYYSRLELYADRLRVRYVLDMAEIPTFQEMSQIDLDANGQVSAAESDRYRLAMLETLRRNLWLEVGGERLELRPATSELSFPPGQSDLKTLRLNAWFEAPLGARVNQGVDLAYRDDNPGQRLGWHEIVVQPGTGIRLDASSVSADDVSDELRTYPADMLASPLDVRSANARFVVLSGAPNAPPLASGSEATVGRAADPFARLIRVDDLNPSVISLALLAAIVYGALHAFTPGHGKAMVGAYLVGSRGTPRHAVLLGLTVTATHTLGVYALGLVTLFAAQFILPETLYPVLGTLSGVMVVAIGVGLFVTRLRASRTGSGRQPGTEHEHEHSAEQNHRHDHGHDHGPGHAHAHGQDHSHTHTLPEGQSASLRNLLALGISGGLVPCPTALLVMLGAMALNRVAFGLVLIIAFSAGLALVLTLTGLALVYAGRLFQRLSIDDRLVQRISAASALLMTVVGVFATVQSLRQLLG